MGRSLPFSKNSPSAGLNRRFGIIEQLVFRGAQCCKFVFYNKLWGKKRKFQYCYEFCFDTPDSRKCDYSYWDFQNLPGIP